MPTARCLLASSLALLASAFSAGAAEGLKPPSDDGVGWSRWQGRISLLTGTTARTGIDGGTADPAALRIRGMSLMGDYVFARSIDAAGGAWSFRATSGIVLGTRSTFWVGGAGAGGSGLSIDRRLAVGTSTAADSIDAVALPYLGVGYSGLNTRGGWGFSADFGLVALGGGSVKLGRVFGAAQGLDDLVREMRLSPVLQLGVSYSF